MSRRVVLRDRFTQSALLELDVFSYWTLETLLLRVAQARPDLADCTLTHRRDGYAAKEIAPHTFKDLLRANHTSKDAVLEFVVYPRDCAYGDVFTRAFVAVAAPVEAPAPEGTPLNQFEQRSLTIVEAAILAKQHIPATGNQRELHAVFAALFVKLYASFESFVLETRDALLRETLRLIGLADVGRVVEALPALVCADVLRRLAVTVDHNKEPKAKLLEMARADAFGVQHCAMQALESLCAGKVDMSFRVDPQGPPLVTTAMAYLEPRPTSLQATHVTFQVLPEARALKGLPVTWYQVPLDDAFALVRYYYGVRCILSHGDATETLQSGALQDMQALLQRRGGQCLIECVPGETYYRGKLQLLLERKGDAHMGLGFLKNARLFLLAFSRFLGAEAQHMSATSSWRG